MITDEIQSNDYLKQPSQGSPLPLEKQARDLSDTVFFAVQSLLQRLQNEASDNLNAYQVLANAEIAHMESMLTALEEKNGAISYENNTLQSSLLQIKHEKLTLQSELERHKTDVLSLQENINRLNTHQRSLHEQNLTLKADMEKLRIQAQQDYQAQEWEYQEKLTQLNQEKSAILAEKLSLQNNLLAYQEEMETHNALLLNEKSALQKTIHDLQQELDERNAVNEKILEKIKEDFEDQLSTAKQKYLNEISLAHKHSDQQLLSLKKSHESEKNALTIPLEKRLAEQETHIQKIESLLSLERENTKNQIAAIRQSHLDEKSALQAHHEQQILTTQKAFKERIQKMESLLALERENDKNKILAFQKNVDNAIANTESARKEKQALLEKCAQIEKKFQDQLQTERVALDKKMHQASLAGKQAAATTQHALEKELAVMAQKKLTAEMNMKQIHKELLECKRIISELRKKQLNYTVVF